MVRKFLLVVAILALATSAWARDTGTVGNTTYIKYYLHPPQIFERMSLPSFGISDCVQDDQGFLWVGTESYGLIRWDGYDQRSYKKGPGASRQLPSSFITDLVVQKDRIWAGTGDAGLVALDLVTDEVKHYRSNEEDITSLSNNGVHVVFLSSKGDLWVATSDGVLQRFDPGKENFQRLDMFEELETEIRAIVEDKDGMLWIGTGSEGVFRFDPNKMQVVDQYASEGGNSLSSNTVFSLLMDEDGILWIGTNEGLNRFNPADNTFKLYTKVHGDRTSLADNSVRTLFRDRDKTLWVGTESGLHTMDKDSDKFLQYVRDPDAPATTANFPRLISCALQDSGGVLYFADPTSALYRVTPTKRMLSPYYYASQITEIINAVNGSKPGVVWGSSLSQGLMRYDFNKREIRVFPVLGDPDSPDSVSLNYWLQAIHRDSKGRLWTGGQSAGLIFFDPKTGAYRQFLHDPDQIEGLTSNDVQDIEESADGSIWIGTFGGGLNRYFPSAGSFMDFVNEPGDPVSLSSNHILVLELDRKDPNIMWVGTARGGLNRFNIRKEKFTRYDLAPEGGKSSDYDTIHTMYQQEDGVLWLGTDGGGLVRFDPSSGDKKYFSEAEGISSPGIYGILPGAEGELWLATNGGGLVRFDPAGPRADSFTKADGLLYDVFNQHGYLRTLDGKLMFTAGNGFLHFDPKGVKVDDFKPPTALTSFKVFNKEADLDSPIWSKPSVHLDYTESVISIEFAGMAFAAPEQNRYMYKMDGLHDWTETKRRFVTYSNLKGGDYTFRVKAANHNGAWSDEEVTLGLSVDPPPWLTWWAYTIYIIILVIILIAYLRYQSRKLEALKQAHRLETVEHELALTGAVQTGFLPASNQYADHYFNLMGFYRPADRAGGDWWWHESADGLLTVLIGDVTGHGPGPAMVTAAAATAYRIQSDLGVTMEQRLHILNREVLRVGAGAYHMTMSAIEIDGRTGRFVYYSAGGQPILRLRTTGKPRLLPCPGTPLGTESFNLGRVEGNMDAGERFMIYTDGIPEIELKNGRLMGMRRFSMLVENTRGTRVDQAVHHIVESADRLRNDRPQDDDWTFSLIEWRGA